MIQQLIENNKTSFLSLLVSFNMWPSMHSAWLTKFICLFKLVCVFVVLLCAWLYRANLSKLCFNVYLHITVRFRRLPTLAMLTVVTNKLLLYQNQLIGSPCMFAHSRSLIQVYNTVRKTHNDSERNRQDRQQYATSIFRWSVVLTGSRIQIVQRKIEQK